MKRQIKTRLRELAHSFTDHLKKALHREESPGQALRQVADATRHNLKRIKEGEISKERKKAKQYVKEGVDAYNDHHYDRASQLFNKAINHDEAYSLAWVYLGNTLYKLGRPTESVQAWQKAVEAEPHSKGADMAREKLTKVGPPKDSLLETIRDQMRTE